jgi:predicted ATPase
MSEKLPLYSFEVEGFRAIRHLLLPELGRVNLFVGLNNAGKTSLLEAISLYLHRHTNAVAPLVFEIVREHTEYFPRYAIFQGKERDIEPSDINAAVEAAESLFYGSFASRSLLPIRIGPAGLERRVLTLQSWAGSSMTQLDDHPQQNVFLAPESPLLEIKADGSKSAISLDWFLHRFPLIRERELKAVLLRSTGLSPGQSVDLWDEVMVSGDEGLVEAAMRVIIPDLERVLVVGESGRRLVLARIKGVPRPVPLQSMGDGVVRVFAISLALVHARGEALLIDEVENGLHFSIQDQVWEAIFRLAQELDVQVFATTHSWDTLVGFQYAAKQSSAKGMLYRLDRETNGRVNAVQYTEREVGIAAEQRIEVR